METKLEVAIAIPGKGVVMNTDDPGYDMAQAPVVLPRAPKYLCQVVNALVGKLIYGFTDTSKTKIRRGSGPKL